MRLGTLESQSKLGNKHQSTEAAPLAGLPFDPCHRRRRSRSERLELETSVYGRRRYRNGSCRLGFPCSDSRQRFSATLPTLAAKGVKRRTGVSHRRM